jgi:hypothetical protein
MPQSLRYDEIGYWSEIKLDIIKEYASAYSRIMSSQTSPQFYHLYIDAVVYYLFFASHKPVAENIVQDIFNKYKNRRGS